MPLKTPSFWYEKQHNRCARFLTPLSWVYAFFAKLYQRQRRTYYAALPVICVGNITVGGSGKTPSCLALVEVLKTNGVFKNPFIVTRGYGGEITQATHVDSEIHTYKEVGDEALLMAQYALVIVARNRYEGATLAARLGADSVILDDGMQNQSLHKDITLCVVDGTKGFGNQRVMPAGPLRETLEEGFERSNGFIVTGEDKYGLSDALPGDKPVFKAALRTCDGLSKSKRYFAFAGLGHPDKFFAFLKDEGYMLIGSKAFADHHAYNHRELQALKDEAIAHNATLLTTEKDWQRLPYDDKKDIEILRVSMSFHDQEALSNFISSALFSAKNCKMK